MILLQTLKYFWKFIKYSSMLPLYWLSLVFPKERNLWVFGAWFGEKYADNSKYLFEYVNKNHPEIKAIWITNNKKIYSHLKKKGYKVYMKTSLKGLFYVLRAYVWVVSTSIRDINIYLSGRMKLIQMWHGIPLKKIMWDDKFFSKRNKSIIRKIANFLFPFLKKEIFHDKNTMLIATSNLTGKLFSSAFKISMEQIKVTGFPRNDAFFLKKYNSSFEKLLEKKKQEGFKIVIYLPTHRMEGKKEVFKNLIWDLNYISTKLEELKMLLLIKLHYYHSKESKILKQEIKKRNIKNIIILDDNNEIWGDIYPILRFTDMLITDYSSIFFDYLLLDRPIIFFPFDYETYIKEDRELYFDYNKITPGPKAKNIKELIFFLEETLKNDTYKDIRKNIRNKFFKYIDGNNSKRVFYEILNILD